MKIMLALANEIRMRHRLGLSVLVIVMLVCVPAYPILGDLLSEWSQFSRYGQLPMAASVLYLVSMLCEGGGDPTRDVLPTIPGRNLILPATSRQLALTPMLAVIILVPACYYYWAFLVMIPAGYQVDLVIVPAAIVVGALLIQTNTYVMGKNPYLSIAVMVVLMVSVGYLAGAGLGAFSTPGWLPRQVVMAVFLGLGPFALLLSSHAVARARIGEPLISDQKFLQIKGPPPPVFRPFSDGRRAQFWYEWRMYGYLQPGLTLICLSLIMIIPLLKDVEPRLFWMLLLIAVGMFLQIAYPAGLEWAGPSLGAKGYDMTLFWATRPLNDRDLAYAKLKMLAGTSFLSWLVTLGAVIVMAVLAGKWEELNRAYQYIAAIFGPYLVWMWLTLVPVMILVLGWIAGGCALALGLSGSKKVVVGTSVGFGLFSLAAFIAMVVTYQTPDNLGRIREIMPHLMGAFALMLLLGLAFAVKVAVRQSLLDGKTLVRVLVPAVVLLGITIGVLVKAELSTKTTVGWVLFCTGLAFGSLIPVIIAPIALRMNRHR